MTYLPGFNSRAGQPDQALVRFSDNGDSRNPGVPGIPGSGLGGSRPTGGNGGDAGKLGVVPNLYASLQLNEKWFIGLGIGAPFGLMTKYDEGWAGQYHSTSSTSRPST